MLSKYDSKLNLLVAYPYFSKTLVEEFGKTKREDYRLIVDSGAFSAYNCGMTIKLEEYHSFMKSIYHLQPDSFVQLDKVFDPKETHSNFLKSRDAGFDVCPVFTRGDDVKYLEKLIDDKEYIFVGGVQGGKSAKPFAKYLLERYSKEKIHYLAFVRPDWLIHYSPYSVDSSTWSSSMRFGKCHLFNQQTGFMREVLRDDFVQRPKEDVQKLLMENGADWNMVKKLAHRESWVGRKFIAETVHDSNPFSNNLHGFISMCSWIRYSIAYQNKIGTKIYIAISTLGHLEMIKHAYYHLKNKGII